MDGRSNRRNNAEFSNFSDVVWTLPNTQAATWHSVSSAPAPKTDGANKGETLGVRNDLSPKGAFPWSDLDQDQ